MLGVSIIGQSGTKIKSLREESGASVQVITENERNVVIVTGFRENVENAVKGVEGIIASKVTTEMVNLKEDSERTSEGFRKDDKKPSGSDRNQNDSDK